MRYVAIGRVHPERANVDFGPVEMTGAGGVKWTVRCKSSQVTVVIDDQPGAVDGWAGAALLASYIATFVVSSVGFAVGAGYTVELLQIVDEHADTYIVGAREGTLQLEPVIKTFNTALSVATRDVIFRYALRDYVGAISDPEDCAFLCYRSIEAICKSFKGWRGMHAALGTTSVVIDPVKERADPTRHGAWLERAITTTADRTEMLLITRNVLSRYLAWFEEHGAKPEAS